MDKEYEANMLATTASKKLNPGCWESLCSSKEDRLNDAFKCYERAGVMYKLRQQWYEAGECYEKCGKIKVDLKEEGEGWYEEAAHCFKKTDKKSKSPIRKLLFL